MIVILPTLVGRGKENSRKYKEGDRSVTGPCKWDHFLQASSLPEPSGRAVSMVALAGRDEQQPDVTGTSRAHLAPTAALHTACHPQSHPWRQGPGRHPCVTGKETEAQRLGSSVTFPDKEREHLPGDPSSRHRET